VNVIVDTCVWSQFFRRNRPPTHPIAIEVARLVRADLIQLIGPIRQEVLSGASPSEWFQQLKEYLRFYPNLPLDEEDDETAADYYNLLRAKGLQATATDLLICAVATRHQLKIFTTDLDFVTCAKYLPIKLHRARGILP
jgi:predicted nucleic acid-binding protein